MGYDRGDSFPFDFEPNRNPFGSKSKGKLSPRSYLIQFERKWKYSFLSEHTTHKQCVQSLGTSAGPVDTPGNVYCIVGTFSVQHNIVF